MVSVKMKYVTSKADLHFFMKFGENEEKSFNYSKMATFGTKNIHSALELYLSKTKTKTSTSNNGILQARKEPLRVFMIE